MSRSTLLRAAVMALFVPILLPWRSAEARQVDAKGNTKGVAGTYGSDYAKRTLLVTPAALNEHLRDHGLVVLQVGVRASYDSAHIAGAVFVQLQDFSTPRKEGALALEMPPVEELRATFERLGISDDSRIVVVQSNEWISPSTRVLLTLDYMGFGERSTWLNGGMDAWKRAGLPVTSAVPTPVPGHIAARAPLPLIVDYAYVQSHASAPHAKLIDARAPVFFDGPPHMGQPTGHIKGAVNVPFDAVYDDSSRVLPPESLAQKFRAAGVQPGDTVIAYCHVGQQATALLFTARLMGHPVRLYDGSMDDWSQRKLPLENGRATTPPAGGAAGRTSPSHR